MNLRIFGFKLTAIILLTLKMMLLFTPLVLSIRAMRAHHFYIIDELQAALFISFGLGMAVSIYNAFEFEGFHHLDLTQYLKTHQQITTTLSEKVKPSDLLTYLEQRVPENGFKILSKSEHGLSFEIKSPYKFKDIIQVTIKNQEVTLQSKPKNYFWPIDLGRNYKNILSMLLVIKQMPIPS